MSNITSAVLTTRRAEAHEVRELFYAFGSKQGHAAYVAVAHILAGALYGDDPAWDDARRIAVDALLELQQAVTVINPARTTAVAQQIQALDAAL